MVPDLPAHGLHRQPLSLNDHEPVKRQRGDARRNKLVSYRRKHKLDLPIGPKAATLPIATAQNGNAQNGNAPNAPSP